MDTLTPPNAYLDVLACLASVSSKILLVAHIFCRSVLPASKLAGVLSAE